MWNPDLGKWAEAMGAASLHATRPEDYAPALRRALDARAPFVIDVDVSLDVKGYRSIWYPYPSNFYEPWTAGPFLRTRRRRQSRSSWVVS